MTNDKIEELLNELREATKQHGNTLVCPKCRTELSVSVAGGGGRTANAVAVKSRTRSQRSGPSQRSRKAVAARAARPASQAKPKAQKRAGSGINVQEWAQQYAKTKHAGRIASAYTDVKKALGSVKGKSKLEIRQLKSDWFKSQLQK